MISDGDSVEAKRLQDLHVHKLGNLTLTGYNSSLSNFEFERKRDRTDKDGRNIGYKNGLSLNKDLADRNNWCIDDIEHRTEKLVAETLAIFDLENEDIE
jgi:hypothetical protein